MISKLSSSRYGMIDQKKIKLILGIIEMKKS